VEDNTPTDDINPDDLLSHFRRPGSSSRPEAPSRAQASGPIAEPGAASGGIRYESTSGSSLELDDLLRYLVEVSGSDLHLTVGAPPLVRVHGDIRPIPGTDVLYPGPLWEMLKGIVSGPQIERYNETWELDTSYTVEGVSRFRVNLFRQRGCPAAVFRSIPNDILPLESLGLPPILYNFAGLPRGLVLVTGPTGSGKSTTLASLLDRANRTRSGHIVTIEDPIEFVHSHRSCVVNQREIGADTLSFSEALRHVLRQDPDIIFVGEMRDLETISVALTAAETGHLVFATLHTQSAQDTVNRIIDVFPPNQQQQIRSQLAATLRGVVCQTLVKTADGTGRAPACEIMVVNTAIATMIRRDETHQIPQALQAGGQLGMQTLNQHLAELVRKGVIDRGAALEVASDVKDLNALMTAEAPGGGGPRPNGPKPPGAAGGLAGSSL